MRFTLLLYVCFTMMSPTSRVHAEGSSETRSVPSIYRRTGVAVMETTWRHRDIELMRAQHRAPSTEVSQPAPSARVGTIDGARRHARLR